LSTVTFDGFTATPAWARLDGVLYAALAPLGEGRLTVIGTLGLLVFPLVFVAVYLLFARWMAWMGDGQLTTGTVARLFVLSLVPIAIAYHLAHYFNSSRCAQRERPPGQALGHLPQALRLIRVRCRPRGCRG
ncbi:MAG TPA: hypothetical protein VHQ69_15195, partial [Methylomirabilota bacterium]|nr:hypothetical protein [Methylomirabilota bacterium]